MQSGGSFFSGDTAALGSAASSGLASGLHQGARVTQRPSDGAVVLELPGARQLLLVHDEQEGGGLAPRWGHVLCLCKGPGSGWVWSL